MKKCFNCGILKQLIEFSTDNTRKDGKHPYCKECKKKIFSKWYTKNKKEVQKHSRQWQINNPEYTHQYYVENKKEILERNRQWYIENKEKSLERNRRWHTENPGYRQQRRIQYKKEYLEYHRKYRIEHKKQRHEYNQQWRAENPEKAKAKSRKSSAKRLSTLKGRLNHCMSTGIGKSLKGSKSGRHWESLTGYTIDQLRKHLERQFTFEMSWQNYGTYWEIDHVIPISVFNFEKPEDLDFKRCWGLKNLRPLEVNENRKKHAKLEKPFQPSLRLAMVYN